MENERQENSDKTEWKYIILFGVLIVAIGLIASYPSILWVPAIIIAIVGLYVLAIGIKETIKESPYLSTVIIFFFLSDLIFKYFMGEKNQVINYFFAGFGIGCIILFICNMQRHESLDKIKKLNSKIYSLNEKLLTRKNKIESLKFRLKEMKNPTKSNYQVSDDY